MAKIEAILNGAKVQPQRDWKELEIGIDWRDRKESPTISVSEAAFAGEVGEYIQKRIMDGTTGGVGVFEGDEFTYRLSDSKNNAYDIRCYLDYADDPVLIGGSEAVVSVKKYKGSGWVEDQFDGITFRNLLSQGFIKPSDEIAIPYTINYLPDVDKIVSLSIANFMLLKTLYELIRDTKEAIVDTLKASTPNAGVPPSYDTGDILGAVLKNAGRIVYGFALVFASKNLFVQIFEAIYQSRRFHKGMTYTRMVEVACEYFNLTLKSELLQNSPVKNWVNMPMKVYKGGDGDPRENCVPIADSPLDTPGGLLNVLKDVFNADYRIVGDTLLFERVDMFDKETDNVIPVYWNDQDLKKARKKLNTDEMLSNYNIVYSYDTLDLNTLDKTEGLASQARTEPVIVKNPDLVNIKNLGQVTIPMSIGVGKDKLNDFEEYLLALAKVVDSVTGALGFGTSFASEIDSRIGSLQLSSHFTSRDKVVYMEGGTVKRNQEDYIGAKFLLENYHHINLLAENNGVHNQAMRFLGVPSKIDLVNFISLLKGNVFHDTNNVEYTLEQAKYRPYSGKIVADIRSKLKYTNNLKVAIG